jgi:hypothetical protein
MLTKTPCVSDFECDGQPWIGSSREDLPRPFAAEEEDMAKRKLLLRREIVANQMSHRWVELPVDIAHALELQWVYE